MKLPQFHLSTLLVLTILAGSLIGLCFTPSPWQPVSERETVQLLDNFGDRFKDCSERVPYNSDIDEESRYDPESRVWSIVCIDKRTGRESVVFSQPVSRDVCELEFSNDKNFALKVDPWGCHFLRRTRPYGWRGWLELPLLWVALLSSVVLIAILVRNWQVNRSSAHVHR